MTSNEEINKRIDVVVNINCQRIDVVIKQIFLNNQSINTWQIGRLCTYTLEAMYEIYTFPFTNRANINLFVWFLDYHRDFF